MIDRLVSKVKRTKISIANSILKRRVKNPDFTIISVDCWGSSIYQEMKIQYNTPFVGLFFFASCYLKLLSNLKMYLDSELSFVPLSKYPSANQEREQTSHYYPIGVLGGDVEVHFLHYENESHAREKWFSRRQRMNMGNLFVEFSDRNSCEERHLKAFDQLDFHHKVVFTSQVHPEIKSAVWLSEFSGQPTIENIYVKRYIYKRHFDIADWLNGGSGRVSLPYKLINHLFEVPNNS